MEKKDTTVVLGTKHFLFEKTQRLLREQHLQVSSALEKAKLHEKEKDEFGSFLEAFDDAEKKILKVVKEEDGITQATLQLKAGLSKTRLSLILAALEEKGIIARKAKGKTKKVFLKKIITKNAK